MIACILQITVKFFIEKYPLAESAQSAADSHGRIVKLCQFTLGISPYWCLKFSHLICIIGSKVISCLIQIYIIQQFFPNNQVYIFPLLTNCFHLFLLRSNCIIIIHLKHITDRIILTFVMFQRT